jgi:hypothetical protein
VNTNDVSGYKVWRQSGEAAAVAVTTVPAGQTEYVDADVVSGIVYTYSVTAVDAAGNESAAVSAPAVSLGPPPTIETSLPPLVTRVRIKFFGVMPLNLVQFRADLAAAIARLLGIEPSRLGILFIRPGSIIVDVEIQDPDSATLSQQLVDALAADPDALANAATALGLETEFGQVLEQSTFTGTSLDFGNVPIGAPVTKIVTIANSATDPEALLIVHTNIAGAGFAVDPASITIGAGASGALNVTFDPAAVADVAGPYAGVLTLSSNDPNSLETVVALSANVLGVPLLPEDFNNDNIVGLDDFFLFADNFGLTSGQPTFNARFDLDSTGDVGLTDFFLFADRFGWSIVGGRLRDAAGQIVTL